ncbi:MAG: DNA primase [Bacteroidetes bacterium]|nr:DNA primase [Bacteroidota bacterium]
MIPKDIVDKIIDEARIEEVVGDFISLKKRGANLLGLCPFHNEKTPSFTVSPAKGIYKCFGCGKAGNSVNFIMDHESLSYPEALRYLAQKYRIEIQEKEISPEEKAQQTERESLLVVTGYAQKYFSNALWDSDEGKSVGLSYFYERGFTDETIRKFQLGYSFEERKAFSKAALADKFQIEYLIKTGLSILSEKHKENSPISIHDIFDRYTSRVIFPIHSGTGKVLGFGGRILGSDKKLAKYINSPQTDIYDKSKVLYGLFFAKKQITQKDVCYLVEGYTDVISMHQAGIENVVSSSGTSLTVEQIKLIHRFTSHITILYDGDLAGIKASFRGIDLILEEGMNVKVLLFPDGDDPDSFSKKVTRQELQEFIEKNAVDFIRFKTNLLYEEAKQDPIKKASLIKEIIESVAIIPDAITRNTYITECSNLLHTNEQTLVFEVQNIRRKKQQKQAASQQDVPQNVQQQVETALFINGQAKDDLQKLLDADLNPFAEQEKNLVRLLLLYGQHIIQLQRYNEYKELTPVKVSVAEYILNELQQDDLYFIDSVCQLFIQEFLYQIQKENVPSTDYFIKHKNPQLAQTAVHLISNSNQLSENWKKKYGLWVAQEDDNLRKTVNHDLFIYKEKRLEKLIDEEKEKLRNISSDEEMQNILEHIKNLEALKIRFNSFLGRTII